ncbi:MAG: GNAT family N-acetyltransferase [Gammaproteobacteria bacterium]
MQIQIFSSIQQIPGDQWNSLVRDNNPLVRHEFLSAMETHGCVGEKFGWLPCHLAIFDNEQLVAAMPLYLKHNSYGEFVFDHSWADAYQRTGHAYFPKLVSAVPYTPARGQRLLCKAGDEKRCYPMVMEYLKEFCATRAISGFHVLFPEDKEIEVLQSQACMLRHDCQYHWFNNAYTDFAEFTAQMTSRKRKNIRRERQAVTNAEVTLRRLNGHTATVKDWSDFATFYNRTFEEKWGMATFNQGFFEEIGRTLPDNVLLVLADKDERCIAGALMYVSDTTLYGRHWGCIEQVDQLHFETCYYQGIEFCIEQGLQVFEPGAQGEHKIARGFVPVMTRSAHWLLSDHLRNPITQFCHHEKQAVEDYMQQLEKKVPFKRADNETLC